MRKYLKLVTVILLPMAAFASTSEKVFNWTPPTQYEDASPLPQSEIASYNIYCDGDLTTPIVNVLNNPEGADTWSAPAGFFSAGDHSCSATTVATNGEESQQSGVVNFTVSALRPNPPVLTVGP